MIIIIVVEINSCLTAGERLCSKKQSHQNHFQNKYLNLELVWLQMLLTVKLSYCNAASMHASGCDLSLPPARSLGVAFIRQQLWINVNIHVNVILLQWSSLFLFSLTRRVKWPPMQSPVAGSLVINVSLNTFLQRWKPKTFIRGGLGKGTGRHNQKAGEGLGSSERAASCSKSNKSCGLKWVFVKTGRYGSYSCQVAND